MFTVLSFGCDRRRLLSRHKVLVAAGFRVTSMDNKDDVLRPLKSHRFHVLVIDYLVPMEDRNEVASQGKFLQNARVIFLYKGRIAGTEMADAVLSVDGSPEDLNSTILWLVRGNAEDVERSTNAV
jgi:DNA-binding NtrC family response regulator